MDVRRKKVIKNDLGKVCCMCHRLLGTEHFYKKLSNKASYCIECSAIYKKKYYKKNRVHLVAESAKYNKKFGVRRRAMLHGISQDTLDAFLRNQNNGCAICGDTLVLGGKNGAHIDHDHTCCAGGTSCGLCVRGILCSPCNKMLGWSRDRPSTLEAAIGYLNNYSHGTKIFLAAKTIYERLRELNEQLKSNNGSRSNPNRRTTQNEGVKV